MNFTLHPSLAQGSIEVADWPLCKVFFKNEKQFPWLVLIPKRAEISEINQLSEADQTTLIVETSKASKFIQKQFSPDKINTAAIGNKVSQLHIHIVGRYKDDPLWPESIWQQNYKNSPYEIEELKQITNGVRAALLPF